MSSLLSLFIELDRLFTVLDASFLVQSPLQHLILNVAVIPLIDYLLLLIVGPIHLSLIKSGALLYLHLHHVAMFGRLSINQLLESQHLRLLQKIP
jgi:hypothetical protein